MKPERSETKGPAFGWYAALSVVVANMIGTGVFTSLGFQLVDFRSGFVIMLLWGLGGIASFCGALAYAELGSSIPRSGGEYTFLSRIYHPGVGFVSGWISATIGFAAPTALAAMTFGSYLASVFPQLSPTWLALGLVVSLSLVHSSNRQASSSFQGSFTSLKVVLIVAFCVLAIGFNPNPEAVSILPATGDLGRVFTGAFAVSLIYVSYAYTGWNAATYLTSEVENPGKTLPLVLAAGTLLVTLLYMGLNYAFLVSAPMEAMAGEIEVGFIAAAHVFGELGGAIMGVALALLLISTVSAMVMAGPRVLQVIGEDCPVFRPLSRKNRHGIPTLAIGAHCVLAMGFIATSSFESVLVFSGFTLGANALLTVSGLYVFRIREPEADRPYRAWGYPVTPAIFCLLTAWTLGFLLVDRPVEAGFGLAAAALGSLLYFVTKRDARP